MNEREFKRRFPRATQATIERNRHLFDDRRSPSKSEQLDKQRLEKKMDETEMEKHYKLKFVDMVFHADHGHELDEDNRRFIVKPLLDALVSLGFAPSDKEIKSDVLQRMDKNNPYI